MKINRLKKVHRHMSFYCRNFGFYQPYQVLVDGTFCQAALQSKVNIKDQLPVYFDSELKFLTTACAIIEVEKFGRLLSGATTVIKQFAVHKCGHNKDPLPASQCILSMLGEDNVNRYVIATQDQELRRAARKVPGTPLLFLFDKVPNLEGPSDASQQLIRVRNKTKVGVSEREQKALGGMKRTLMPSDLDEGARPKKKKKKWHYNKLQKQKAKPTVSQGQTSGKNKRPRQRVKIAKHVRELLGKK